MSERSEEEASAEESDNMKLYVGFTNGDLRRLLERARHDVCVGQQRCASLARELERRDAAKEVELVRGKWIPLSSGVGAVSTADGPLPAGLYVARNSEYGGGHMPVLEDGSTDDWNYTHVLAVDGALVRLDEGREEEGSE